MARQALIATTLLALGVVSTACEPHIPEGTLLCTVDDTRPESCPPGFHCCPAIERSGYDGVCIRGGSCDGGVAVIDAGDWDAGVGRDAANADAGDDAGSPDAGVPPAPIAVAAGAEHSCSLYDDGAVYCWGNGIDGRLGNDATPTSPETSPVAVVDLPPEIEEIGAGEVSTCARTSTHAYCWGDNSSGQLGRTGMALSARPVEVALSLSAGVTIASLSVGDRHACVALSDGSVRCWGRNWDAQLGRTADFNANSDPLDVAGVTNAVVVACGTAFSCARIDDGTVSCWGKNDSGQLGRGIDSAQEPMPALVVGVGNADADATAIATGNRHACALVASGAVCWGANGSGQLGDGTLTTSNRAVMVMDLPSPPALLSAGGGAFGNHTCAGRPSTLRCWGSRLSGQIGDGGSLINARTATEVSASWIPSAVATGQHHTCAIGDGAVYCWGANGSGQLGDRTTTGRNRPVRVADPL
ncbi:MAG: RCC1 domain-containing protein [Sandaracinaceae bacterium]